MSGIKEPQNPNRVDDVAQARHRRQQALDDLAHAQRAASRDAAREEPHAGSRLSLAHSGRMSRMRVLALIVLSVIVVAGITGGVLLKLRAPASTKPPQAPHFALANLKAAGIACTSDAEWSPDSTRIAVLGYLGDCPNFPFPKTQDPGVISLYTRAASGHLLLKQFPLDDTVLKAIPVFASVQQAFRAANLTAFVAIDYTRVLWSRDGNQIAIVLTAYVPSGPPSPTTGATDTAIWPQVPVRGVLLLDSRSGQARIYTTAINSASPRYTEWDLNTGAPILPASSMVSSSDTATLPPALAYSWGADSALQPEMPLNSTAAPPTPPEGDIGNPDSGGAFTIWQPGTAALNVQAARGAVETPGVYTWTPSDFAAWSPDGRYLVDHIEMQGRIEPAGQPVPTHQTLVKLYADHLPLLPVRDKGLQALLASMPPATYDPLHQAYEVAWRPDGGVLAAQPRNRSSSDDLSAHTVTLYDCASGKLLTTLKPPVQYSFVGGESVLRWSSDGTRLLLVDPDLGVLVVWNRDALLR